MTCTTISRGLTFMLMGPRQKGKEGQYQIFEEIMAENFPKLMKIINVYM